ncbi:MAG TPA: 23S rRNA (pseudouridine(1915)-N(3))-methyltransferase RlmH [Coxiellaceae bacterium]|nr:MAG: 23S rRNA (pseudouridine(1915)-N(3))-methyltransferase RlmH [Gammaproteobacteria bacterium RIFCSPHIGHO2_12_FULL_36_30]HLB56814.1 23S rRNA (pseudouridine(1915)-N(3))-methyltransferase RlmH [Coxiellaceae bacterium]
MLINIIAIGKNMPSWINEGYDEYAKRMPQNYSTHLIEISAEKRTKNSDIKKIIAIEESKMRAAIPKGSYCIALDRTGKMADTKTLAKRLQTWHDNGQTICFMIGGPEGLSESFLKNADEIWSLSAMTFPHPLVRIVLSEQLYRAWSITVNHPYHR